MSVEFIGFTIEVMGKILVAFMAIMVHRRFWKEHKIDTALYRDMKREQVIGGLGIAMIIFGYFLQIPAKF